MSRESRIIDELRRAGFTVLTRKQWGSRHRARYQTRRATRRFVGPADHAFAHITVTRDDGPLIGEFKADMREVERIGQERFGTGFPYNWGVDQDTGAIAVGQPLDAAGAHTVNDKGVDGFHENLNYWGHAIAWIGMPDDSISDKAIDAYAAIIAAEKKHGAMKPGARLYPHSKFAWKDCPCDQVRDRIGYIERTAETILEENDMSKMGPENWDDADWKVAGPKIAAAVWHHIVRDADGTGRWTQRLLKQAANSLRVTGQVRSIIQRHAADLPAEVVAELEAALADAETDDPEDAEGNP